MKRVTFSALSVGSSRASRPSAAARMSSDTQAVVIPTSVISIGTEPSPTDLIVVRSDLMPKRIRA